MDSIRSPHPEGPLRPREARFSPLERRSPAPWRPRDPLRNLDSISRRPGDLDRPPTERSSDFKGLTRPRIAVQGQLGQQCCVPYPRSGARLHHGWRHHRVLTATLADLPAPRPRAIAAFARGSGLFDQRTGGGEPRRRRAVILRRLRVLLTTQRLHILLATGRLYPLARRRQKAVALPCQAMRCSRA